MGISLEQLRERLVSTGKPVKLVCDDGMFNHDLAHCTVAKITCNSIDGDSASEDDVTLCALDSEVLEHMAFAEPEQETVRLWEMVEGVRYARTGGGSILFFVRDATHVRVYSHEKSSGTIIDDIYNYIDGTFTEIKPKKVVKTVEAWQYINMISGRVLDSSECESSFAGYDIGSHEAIVKLTGTYETYE